MRLLVISHTPHHVRDGRLVGWSSTVREIDQLATRFTSVRHVAFLHEGDAPEHAVAYAATNVTVVPVPPAGGESVRDKLGILTVIPRYAATIARELAQADVVHVRAPANIALVALAVLAVRRTPRARWFKYAGDWRPRRRDHVTYAVQRWLLRRRWHHGIVTVNGDVRDEPPWVHAFYNPSLEEQELAAARAMATTKHPGPPLRLVHVGRVEPAKGTHRAIDILERCRARGIDTVLDIVGDGPSRTELERAARARGLDPYVTFHGWLGAQALRDIYQRAHISLLPSATEGWPKVLSEGMAFGAVPVASAVGSIPSYLAELRTGMAIAPEDLDGFVATIAAYASSPGRWREESARAVDAAQLFTFQHYLRAVDALLAEAAP